MEPGQRARIWGQYKHLDLPDIEVLDIADDYEFLDEELVDLLFKVPSWRKFALSADPARLPVMGRLAREYHPKWIR